jgi:galactose-6-phosphate isomerase
MATLDVSDVPICAEFADTFQVLRRIEVVDGSGRSITTTEVIATPLGTIYPTGDNGLTREAEYEAGHKSLTIVTPYRLQGPAPGFQPDLIEYRGNEFVITDIEDYSQYGAGFVVAQATSIEAIQSPPQ